MDKPLMQLHTAYNKHVWVRQPVLDHSYTSQIEGKTMLLRCHCGCYALSDYGNQGKPGALGQPEALLHGALTGYAKRMPTKAALKDLLAYAKLYSSAKGIKEYLLPATLGLINPRSRLAAPPGSEKEDAARIIEAFTRIGREQTRAVARIYKDYKGH